MKPNRRKTRIWIVFAIVAVVIAAPFVYGAFQPDHFPCEPPINEQVKSQYDALMSGADIPLPIPLVVGDTELREFSLDALRETLLTNGFKEVTKDNLTEFSADVQAQYRNMPLFASPDEKIVVEWTQNLQGMILISPAKKRMSYSELERYTSDGCGSAISLLIRAEIGSDIEEILRRIRWIDYYYHNAYLFKRTIDNSSQAIFIFRGTYYYMLSFKDGMLKAIYVFCLQESTLKDIEGLSEHEALAKLHKLFKSNTILHGRYDKLIKKYHELLWDIKRFWVNSTNKQKNP